MPPRINWGAMQATDYLLKLIQLKYPTFPSRVSPTTCNVSCSHIVAAMDA